MRLLLKDRITASAIALLISYLLILQGLFGAMASGAMAAKPEAMQVICTSSGYAQSDTVADKNAPSGDSAFELACASLCSIAAASQLGILKEVPTCLAAYSTRSPDHCIVSADLARPPLRGLIAEPRAPPAVL